MATKKSVKGMADRLISTLDSLMPSEKADAIVRDVAEELYRDILGIEGSIVVDQSQGHGYMHGGFGKNGKRAALPIAKYKFEPAQNSGQPKACWLNIEVGRYVMLDHIPYKPFEIAGMSNEGEGYVRLEDSKTGASKTMTPKAFDAAGYVFAEVES